MQKCSNNAYCFCLTKMLEKKNASIMYKRLLVYTPLHLKIKN